jgi:peptide/nickel transport system substrate-binding protein
VLVRNPDYWQGWDGDHVDEVVLETVPEESTRLLRLERGDVDIATVTATSLPALEQRIAEQNLPIVIQKERDGQPLLSLSTMWLNLNHQMLPTSDINVRKALIHAFNYDLWIEQVLNGYGLRMQGMIPRGVLGHVEDYPMYPYDLEQAQAFLDEASTEAKAALEEGLPFRYSPGYVIQTEGALLWQQDLASIGINLVLEEIDQATLSSLQTSEPGVPIVEARWFPDYPDPDNFINAARTDYWPPEGYGAAFAGDDTTDDLVARGRTEQDPEQRAEIYRELELHFHDQASILMLAELSGAINPWNGRAEWVQGFEVNPMIHPLYYNVSKASPA